MTLHRSIVAVAAVLLLLAPFCAAAEPGLTATTITFGQAAALSGPVAALGTEVRRGLLAAFDEANARGGVNGRRLELISRDDGYEPEASVAATRQLIDRDHVFALAGAVGTPPSLAALPIAQDAGVPFIGPFTGAGFLRQPANGNVVNLRASYAEEAEFMVAHLTQDLGITRVGILYQDDFFGRAGLTGLQRALDKRGLKLAAEGTFERNTRAIKTALALIRRADPQAVIMFGPYGPCAAFIALARELRFNPVFFASSFTGLAPLAQELGAGAAGIYHTQVVPLPANSPLTAAADYRAALAALDPKASPDAVGFEGYLVGRLIVAALADAGVRPTRQSFLAAIAGHEFDLGGVRADFRAPGNQAAAQISLAVIGRDGKARTITSLNAATN